MDYVAGVDVGATKIRVGLFSLGGVLLNSASVLTPREGDELTIAEVVVSLIRRLSSGIIGRLVAVGVGTIGPIDIRQGDVVGSPNTGLMSFKLKKPMEEALGVKVYVVNDCVAAVWGEYTVGAGRGFDNVVYVTLSTGIGGGAIVDGHLLLGKDGNAHEVGHIVLDYSGRFTCGCGAPGHWEGIASGANIPRTARILGESWRGPRVEAYEKALEEKLLPEDLFYSWYLGDVFAEYVVSFLVEVNAAGIASVINVYDPEVLTIGGSIATKNPQFVELMVRKVSKYLINRSPRISLTSLGDNAVVIGAAMIAINTPSILIKIQG